MRQFKLYKRKIIFTRHLSHSSSNCNFKSFMDEDNFSIFLQTDSFSFTLFPFPKLLGKISQKSHTEIHTKFYWWMLKKKKYLKVVKWDKIIFLIEALFKKYEKSSHEKVTKNENESCCASYVALQSPKMREKQP
jgi:hypothetical protein